VNTEIGFTTELKADEWTEKDPQPRAQALAGKADTEMPHAGRKGGTRSGYPRELEAQMGPAAGFRSEKHGPQSRTGEAQASKKEQLKRDVMKPNA
jgi:hypothetical protein